MAARTYSGAWARKAATPTLSVPLKPQPDPEHLNPTANPEFEPGVPLWVNSAPAPMLPDTLTQIPVGVPIGGGGPLDREPLDHDYGPGASPGVTQAESRQIMAPYHETDMGAVAARQWMPLTSRADGPGPQLAIITDTPGDGDSPQTLVYERSGVGAPTDPYARTGKRQKRWWDRFIDMHRWGVDYRPMTVRYARPVPNQPPVANGTQLDSPYGTLQSLNTPDKLVEPQLRRTPPPWDQSFTTDGTQGGNEFGLTSWGL